MPHHLLNERELKTFCIYCKSEVPVISWKSEWHFEAHYKTVLCKCGKSLHMKVNFEGSGHDSWNGKKFTPKILGKNSGKSIEDKIRIIEQPEIAARHFPKK